MFGRAGLKVLSAARRTFGKGAALRVADPVRSGLAASIDDWPWSSCCRTSWPDPCPVASRDRLAGARGRTVIREPSGVNR
jgi:hypothetical protein